MFRTVSPRLPRMEQPRRRRLHGHSAKRENGVGVYLVHAARLREPVTRVSLDNAHRVDPDVLQAAAARHGHSVADGCRELVDGKRLTCSADDVGVHGSPALSGDVVGAPPAVTQGDVSDERLRIVDLDELDFGCR